MKKTTSLLTFIIAMLILSGSKLLSQVGIMPAAIFIDSQTRSGSMKLINSGEMQREVEISFKFGYPLNDENGNAQMVYDDSVTEAAHSLVPYVKVFPRKLVMMPKSEQTVRFLAMVPNDLPDGTYWSRISILNKPIENLVSLDTNQEEISAGMILNTEVVSIVVYHKGQIQVKPILSDLAVEKDSAAITANCSVDKLGNSPFWGNVRYTLLDDDDDVVLEHNHQLAIYKRGKVKHSFPREELEPGSYKVKVTLYNERDDIPEDIVGKTKPISITETLYVE